MGMFKRKVKEVPPVELDPRVLKATGTVVLAARELRAALREQREKERGTPHS